MVDAKKIVGNWPKSLDSNGLSEPQKDGVTILVDIWNTFGDGDNRKLAYLLATVWHETAKTMQPIEEWGKGTKKPYGKPDQVTGQSYYGRGYVQLTWKENYDRFGKMVNLDLVKHPNDALDPKVSAVISVMGMIKGGFTGKKFSDYFTSKKTDWKNARKIINAMDKAEMIADYAIAIHSNLTS